MQLAKYKLHLTAKKLLGELNETEYSKRCKQS